MNLFIYTGASEITAAAVASASDLTPATLPQLVAGDTPSFTVKFLSALSAFESWSGQSGYTLSLSLGLPSSDGSFLCATNSTFSQVTNGWTGTLALTSHALANIIAGVLWENPRRSQIRMTLQVAVTDNSGNRVTYAELPINVRALIATPNQAAPA